ncbi:MAG: serine hydrolase [Tahibacter sp.]
MTTKAGVWIAFVLLWMCGVVSSASSATASVAERQSIEHVLAAWDHDEHPDLKALVVRRHGQRIAERYYHQEGVESLHDIRSAGKSITALLFGAAMDRGRLHGVGEMVAAYLPEAKSSPIGMVSLEQLLSDIGGQRIPVFFASGNGGNKIYVVPSRALVVAVTSSAYGHGYGQRRSERILKALLSLP